MRSIGRVYRTFVGTANLRSTYRKRAFAGSGPGSTITRLTSMTSLISLHLLHRWPGKVYHPGNCLSPMGPILFGEIPQRTGDVKNLSLTLDRE